MLYVVKRDGRTVEFNGEKIAQAIKGAALEIGVTLKESQVLETVQKVITYIEDTKKQKITVEEIQNLVEKALNEEDKDIAFAYSSYRRERTRVRDIKSDLMKAIEKIGVETDRDNANVGNNFSSKLLRIASESNKWHNLANMPKQLSKAHETGDLYYHDLDSYNLTTNCLHIPTKEILLNGFNTGYGTINVPKRIETAAELSCILLQSTQNDMFGGQSHPDFDNDLGVFVAPTREEIKKELEELEISKEKIDKLVEKTLRKRVHQAMQGVMYNLNTMHSRAGSQVPFSSVNIGIPNNKDAALICEVFLLEYEKGLGKGEQPIFPNIIFRVKDGVNREENDPYYYLYKLACRVAAKRMNPTFMNIDADFNKEYYDKGYVPATMGCRTYLMKNVNGEPGCKGRGNIAPTTINLPRIGLQAKGDIKKFFNILDARLSLAKDSLLHRYGVLKNLKVKDLPFIAGQNLMVGSENLDPEDSIEPILKQGTWGIGFIGLAEALIALTGKHHGETEEAKELGLKIIGHIRSYCDRLTEEYSLNWSCYATPAEGLSGKFIKQDQKTFGSVQGVTDKEYYTNSYHVPVGYAISIKDKIDIEAPYHKLCNGGHITYIEVDDFPNEEVVMDIINYAYKHTNISYMGVNFHIRYCKNCGTYLHSNESKCSTCGSNDIQGVSRVTGYLSLDERFGPGKYQERTDRISHLESHKKHY
ncbi:anaerobic ribonucleoside triphosphate reductase [Clostridium taeniosporum]|uniref:Anaerobic ribonucleoside triphosphate reductase n=1 Tax=Clostridium taeniosporum TaxID=394958 RepID=A0A1D7XGU2_9CLOT|nr:anaerobic ribonucleoside triphosphate reductase [Clostridium taeniosporum]AOR22310.1 anaerobic ribonucleoside triphosphate reductase [Clostridium taeniosporum]